MGSGRESVMRADESHGGSGPSAPGAESIGAGAFSVFPGRMGEA